MFLGFYANGFVCNQKVAFWTSLGSGKGREGNGREGKGREWKGREGKGILGNSSLTDVKFRFLPTLKRMRASFQP